MQKLVQTLPAIALLILFILMAVWIVPLLIHNLKNFDWVGRPKTVAQSRTLASETPRERLTARRTDLIDFNLPVGRDNSPGGRGLSDFSDRFE